MIDLRRYAVSSNWVVLGFAWLFLMICALFFKPSVSLGGVLSLPYLDKMAHFGLFFGQFCLLGKAFIDLPNRLFWSILPIFAMLLAIGTELGQGYLTDTRLMEFWDGVADMAGATAALGFVQWTKF